MKGMNLEKEMAVHCGKVTDSMETLETLCCEKAEKLLATLDVPEGGKVDGGFSGTYCRRQVQPRQVRQSHIRIGLFRVHFVIFGRILLIVLQRIPSPLFCHSMKQTRWKAFFMLPIVRESPYKISPYPGMSGRNLQEFVS